MFYKDHELVHFKKKQKKNKNQKPHKKQKQNKKPCNLYSFNLHPVCNTCAMWIDKLLLCSVWINWEEKKLTLVCVHFTILNKAT